MCLEERSFGSCSAWRDGEKMAHLEEMCVWEGLGVGENNANKL